MPRSTEPAHLSPVSSLVHEMPGLFRAILRDHLEPPPMSPEAMAAWLRASEIIAGLDERDRRARIRAEREAREYEGRTALREEEQASVADQGKVTEECSERVWGGWSGKRTCSRPGRFLYHGSAYCKQHLTAKIADVVSSRFRKQVEETPDLYENEESLALNEVLDQERMAAVMRWVNGGQ